MTLLAELFDRLEHAPMAAAQRQAGMVEVGATVLAFEARQRPADMLPAPQTPAPTPTPTPAATSAPVAPQNAHAQNVAQTEGPPAARRNAWTITRNGRPVCTVCGAPMTRTEALAEARWRWPDAGILEN